MLEKLHTSEEIEVLEVQKTLLPHLQAIEIAQKVETPHLWSENKGLKCLYQIEQVQLFQNDDIVAPTAVNATFNISTVDATGGRSTYKSTR